MTKTALYKHFAEDGSCCLYIGITDDIARRNDEHAKSAPWFAAVSKTEIDWFDDRGDALLAERHAIAEDNPIHNVRRDTGPLPTLADGAWRSAMHSHLTQCGLSMRSVSIDAGCGAGYLHGVLFDGKDPTIDRFLRICASAGADPVVILDLPTEIPA